jgi:hypothetical protein
MDEEVLMSDDDRALADAATRSLLTTTTALCTSLAPRGYSRVEPGVFFFVTGGQVATLNGLMVTDANAESETIARLLDEVAATGLPHRVQVRPAVAETVAAVLVERGMTARENVPLMVRTDPLPPVVPPNGLTMHTLARGQMSRYNATAAAGFEAPEEVFAELMIDDQIGTPGLRFYLGEANGEPVTTGAGFVADGLMFVFNIGTPPAQRRHGYGSAMTAHIVAEGLAVGAHAAYLQSSEQGYRVYQSLGFRTVEEWTVWA